MTNPTDRTVAVLLASGLSRRFKRRDKLVQDLAGQPLIEHMAGKLSEIDFLARVAVCPPRSDSLRNRLDGRFVIAPNASPEAGLGVSISVGVRVALQFRPECILLCLGDMPFVETRSLIRLLDAAWENPGIDILHAGRDADVRPPAVFRRTCFESLQTLKGEQGAGVLIKRQEYTSQGIGLANTELFDVDTAFDLETARQQYRVRQRCLGHHEAI